MVLSPAKTEYRTRYDSCPLCDGRHQYLCSGGTMGHPLFSPELGSPNLNWHQCETCHHVFTEGYLNDSGRELMLAQVHDHQTVGGAETELWRIASARMLDKIVPFVSHGKFLDVGFGNGALLLTAKEYGFDPVGLDLRAENVDALKANGVEGYCCDIETLVDRVTHGGFSVIAFADSLEHIPFPKSALNAAYDLLGMDGYLFLSMPNSESWAWHDLNERNANPYWGEIEHYHNFSRSRLYLLLDECGFKPVRYGVSERYRVCLEVIAERK